MRFWKASTPAVETGRAHGSVDRAHDGLITGWFACDLCATQQLAPTVTLVSHADRVEIATSEVPRTDVPGAIGFVARFARNMLMTKPEGLVISCSRHPFQQLHAPDPGELWGVLGLAAIEHVQWPVVTGWIALLVPDATSCISIAGLADIHIDNLTARPDVEQFLGAIGVHGFQVNLALQCGYSLEDGASIELKVNRVTLATSRVRGAPASTLCDHLHVTQPMPAMPATRLLRDAPAPKRNLMVPRPHSPNHAGYPKWAGQWAEFFEHHGFPQAMIEAWIALEDSNARGVTSLSTLSEPQVALTNEPARAAAGHLHSALTRLQSMYGVMLNDHDPNRIVERMRARLVHLHDRDRFLAPPATSAIGLSAVHGSAQPWMRASTSADRRVCVAGLGTHRSGLGMNAANSVTALSMSNHHVCNASFMPELGGWNRSLGLVDHQVLDLSDHSVLLHLPIDRVEQSLSAQPALLSAGRLIGYFMWETAAIPRELERGLQLVDEIWTASHFVKDALQTATDIPVHVTGHAVDVRFAPRTSRAELALDDDCFIAHFSFDANSTIARKNPTAALKAFELAFGDDSSALFLMKIRNFQQAEHQAASGDHAARELLSRIHAMPNVRLITSELSRARTLGLLSISDCYISLHRSEGFGYTIAEATKLGVPVIATDYSANVEYFDPQDGWLIPRALVPVLPNEYFYWQPDLVWADADVDAAARALIEVRRLKESGSRREPLRTSEPHSMQELSARYSSLLTN